MTVLFPPGGGGGTEAAYGYKGKGVLIHLLADADGMPLAACSAPANEDERKQAGTLLEMIAVKTGKPGQQPKKLRSIAADKGYDSDPMRNFLKSKGIRPQIPRKKNTGKRRGRPVSMKDPRFQAELTFFMTAEKVSPSGCPMGKIAKMF